MHIPYSVRSCPLFFELHKSEIESIVKDSTIMRFEKEEKIIRQGELGEELFIILSGLAVVEVIKNTSKEQKKIQELVYGDVFGELCIIGEKKRQADVVCIESCDVLRISYNSIYALYKKQPKCFGILMLNISRLLTKRLFSMIEEAKL